MRHRGSRNEQIGEAAAAHAPSGHERRAEASVRARRWRVERQRVPGCHRPVQAVLPARALFVVACGERTDRQLGDRDGRDGGSFREPAGSRRGRGQSRPTCPAGRDYPSTWGSMRASRSARNRSASIRGALRAASAMTARDTKRLAPPAATRRSVRHSGRRYPGSARGRRARRRHGRSRALRPGAAGPAAPPARGCRPEWR